MHPQNPICNDLLLKKRNDLIEILDTHEIECQDKTRNSEIRKAIWESQEDLDIKECEIELSKIESRNIWEQIKLHMPLYTLFQSDRKNNDGDSEIQDPMRLAIREILQDETIQNSLREVADSVKTRLEEVASRTLSKLGEMNQDIANSLNPKLSELEKLKWADVFKNVSITGDEDIPINKRGSGVKRLILINFFRAEAERRQQEENLPNIIYAVEEPETSQHPEQQRALIDALTRLSTAGNSQILLTTHSPEVVKKLAFNNILLITGREPGKIYQVQENELPYPSLNEVNYIAFNELSIEYHNELYSYIEAEDLLSSYKNNKPSRAYIRILRNGQEKQESIVLTEYIRNQIHHPENDRNVRFTDEELKQSIEDMRNFIAGSRAASNS